MVSAPIQEQSAIFPILEPSSPITAEYWNCMLVLRQFRPDIRGDARYLKPNTDFPQAGGVVIFKYRNGENFNDWHAGYIMWTSAKRIGIYEGWLGEERERVISITDTTIFGFIEPIQSG